MPQLTHHDFYSNFTASLKAGDLDLTNDILANEISDFIVFDVDKIIEALNKSDIKITKDSTDEQIVDLVIKNINTNKKLVSALSFIIAEGNEMLLDNDKTKQLKIIETISKGLSKVGKDISSNSASFKTSTMDQVVSKAAKRTEYKRTIWNKDKGSIGDGKILLIGLGVIALAVIVIYFRQKSSIASAIPNMINGPDMSAMTLPAQPTIVPVAPIEIPQPQIVQPIPLLPEVPVPQPLPIQTT